MAQAKVVIIDPRISSTVNVSRTTGAQALHLRPKLGTDYMLANAVARILEGLDKTKCLFVVVQNIYQVETAHDAHLILPAAQWGEMALTSLNCNSRLLRIYERFTDPPGDARQDWEIHGMISQKLEALYIKDGKADTAKGFSGMDWKDGADVLKAAELDLFAKVDTKVPASKRGILFLRGSRGSPMNTCAR